MTPPGCVPSKNDKAVADTCGVFVSSSLGQDSNMGSQAAPFKTLQHALDQAKGMPVYVCAEPFSGSVTLANPNAIYGGLDCTNGWAYVGATKKTTLTGDVDRVAFTIGLNAKGTELVDFTILAGNATVPGGSSIAVVVDGSVATLTRCDLIAADALPGEDGERLADDKMLDGDTGGTGINICATGANSPGGKGKTKACLNGDMSVGGTGGDGGGISGTTPLIAGGGADGSPPDATQTTKGKGGAGEGQGGATACISGTDGASGGVGASGEGAAGAGSLSPNGYIGVKGSEGGPGKAGQGGGGGGGAKGGGAIDCGAGPGPRFGASGGAGGTGGCGGGKGGGGTGGGSSIALVSLQATVTLTEVKLSAGKGGAGGKGGGGQSGGQPGIGGTFGNGAGAGKPSCQGGRGGVGGTGGSGGGGQGGHSLGVAFKGMAPEIDPSTVTIGEAGQGGPGGEGNITPNSGKGADGIAMPTQEFM